MGGFGNSMKRQERDPYRIWLARRRILGRITEIPRNDARHKAHRKIGVALAMEVEGAPIVPGGRKRSSNASFRHRLRALPRLGVLYWPENSTIKDGCSGPFVLLARNTIPEFRENFIKFEFLRDPWLDLWGCTSQKAPKVCPIAKWLVEIVVEWAEKHGTCNSFYSNQFFFFYIIHQDKFLYKLLFLSFERSVN